MGLFHFAVISLDIPVLFHPVPKDQEQSELKGLIFLSGAWREFPVGFFSGTVLSFTITLIKEKSF